MIKEAAFPQESANKPIPSEALPSQEESSPDNASNETDFWGKGLEQKRRHVMRIAKQLDPEPSAFHFAEYRHGTGGVCACGQKIEHQFVLRDPAGHEVTIGSTCIDDTVPYLISMGAEELAEAIRTEWKHVLTTLRRERQQVVGMEKLSHLLPLAFALTDWYQRIRAKLYSYQLPPYFQKAAPLYKLGTGTPAKQAANLQTRILNFRERIPLLQKALSSDWEAPPEKAEVSADWMELVTRYEEYVQSFSLLKNDRANDLPFFEPELARQVKEFIDSPRVFTEQQMRDYVQKAESIASHIPTPHQIKQERERLQPEFERLSKEIDKHIDVLKKAEDTYREQLQSESLWYIHPLLSPFREALENLRYTERPRTLSNLSIHKRQTDYLKAVNTTLSFVPSIQKLKKISEHDQILTKLQEAEKSIARRTDQLNDQLKQQVWPRLLLNLTPRQTRDGVEYQTIQGNKKFVLTHRSAYKPDGAAYYRPIRTIAQLPGQEIILVERIATIENTDLPVNLERLTKEISHLEEQLNQLKKEILTME